MESTRRIIALLLMSAVLTSIQSTSEWSYRFGGSCAVDDQGQRMFYTETAYRVCDHDSCPYDQMSVYEANICCQVCCYDLVDPFVDKTDKNITPSSTTTTHFGLVTPLISFALNGLFVVIIIIVAIINILKNRRERSRLARNNKQQMLPIITVQNQDQNNTVPKENPNGNASFTRNSSFFPQLKTLVKADSTQFKNGRRQYDVEIFNQVLIPSTTHPKPPKPDENTKIVELQEGNK